MGIQVEKLMSNRRGWISHPPGFPSWQQLFIPESVHRKLKAEDWKLTAKILESRCFCD